MGGGSSGPSALTLTEGDKTGESLRHCSRSFCGCGLSSASSSSSSSSSDEDEDPSSSSQDSATGFCFGFGFVAWGWVWSAGRGISFIGVGSLMERSRREDWSSFVVAVAVVAGEDIV